VCARLGLEASAGLGDVLAGERTLADVMLEFPLDSPRAGRLNVLPAGPPPPNPAALLNSQPMRSLVQALERQADLVILDSVAALAVSDALPLLRAVSGCVVVVRMNRSSRAAVRRLHKMLGSANGTVLGVAATGTGAMAGGYTTYPYGQNGHRGGAVGMLHLRRARARAPLDTARSNGAAIDPAGSAPAQSSARLAGSESPDDHSS
jgi:Mrp family chromosome partitioning ATPase